MYVYSDPSPSSIGWTYPRSRQLGFQALQIQRRVNRLNTKPLAFTISVFKNMICTNNPDCGCFLGILGPTLATCT